MGYLTFAESEDSGSLMRLSGVPGLDLLVAKQERGFLHCIALTPRLSNLILSQPVVCQGHGEARRDHCEGLRRRWRVSGTG